MSVAIDVRSDVRFRSISSRRCSGRSSGIANNTINGAVTSTTMPSLREVESTNPAITRYAIKAPTKRDTTSVNAPNSSESLAETLSTSPVGVRCGSTCPIWVALRVTSFIEPYMATSHVRTTTVWPSTLAMIPMTTRPNMIRLRRTTVARSCGMIPSSTILPTR